MPYIDVGGVQHYYEVTGSSGKVGAPPLVLIHGWCGSARYWQPLVQDYGRESLCLSYDLRGFGRSAAGAQDFSLESYSHDLLVLLDKLGLEQVDINAHSMGASIGLAFANLYPERVRKLVLTCTGVFEYQMLPFETFYFFSNLVIAVRPNWIANFAAIRRSFQRRFVHQLLSDEFAQLFIEDYVIASAAAARGTLYSSIGKHATFEMPDSFRRVRVPTLLISGQHDRIIPARGAQKAQQINPRLGLEILEDTGHFPMLEKPSQYMHIMRSFLQV